MHPFPLDIKLPTQHLAACFNNVSTTYKYYWFLAIMDIVADGRSTISKRELFARMVANAWYTVNYFHVSFGQQDLIQRAVETIKTIEGITIDERKEKIVDILLASEHTETLKTLKHFDLNVPHWFLSPWCPNAKKADIYRLSQEGVGKPLYQLYSDHIVMDKDWAEYLFSNIRIVKDFAYWNLTLFLQVRNPNVPDIANKLIKQAKRNSLTKQRLFWDYVIDRSGPIACIYTGRPLYKGDYHVEHFVPYSFVSHDQIWNLIPADNSFNLTKGNKLPPIEQYFELFYENQRLAVATYLEGKPKEKLLEDYFYVDKNWQSGLSHDNFKDVIEPLVTIASLNGFEFLQ